MSNAKMLNRAKVKKNDEFYTRYEDIEKEVLHYKEHFKNKIVFLNCDDPFESNFFLFFCLKFNELELKRIYAISYKNSAVAGKELPTFKQAMLAEINEIKEMNNDGILDTNDIKMVFNNPNNFLINLEDEKEWVGGDFRSKKSVEILEKSDIVVTNPPFSLFREFVDLLNKKNKKFLIIGHQNSISYKDIFKLIKENKLWLGYGFKGGAGHFINKIYEDYASASDHQKGKIRVSGVVWFTNLEHNKRHEFLPLVKSYKKNPDYFKKYDNFDAINVDKTKEIPYDYYGFMGVPITFLDKFNPEQFEIIGKMSTTKPDDLELGYPYINGKKVYARIIIRNLMKE